MSIVAPVLFTIMIAPASKGGAGVPLKNWIWASPAQGLGKFGFVRSVSAYPTKISTEPAEAATGAASSNPVSALNRSLERSRIDAPHLALSLDAESVPS